MDDTSKMIISLHELITLHKVISLTWISNHSLNLRNWLLVFLEVWSIHLNWAHNKSSAMDVSSWIVKQDPVKKVINCQGLCKPGGIIPSGAWQQFRSYWSWFLRGIDQKGITLDQEGLNMGQEGLKKVFWTHKLHFNEFIFKFTSLPVRSKRV